MGSRAGSQPSRQAVAGAARGGRGRSAKVAPAGAQLARAQGSGKRLPALGGRDSTERPNNQVRTHGNQEVGQRAAGFFADGDHPDAWAIEDVSSSP